MSTMRPLSDFSDAELIKAALVRDGGSVVLILRLSGQTVTLRRMRAIREQGTARFGWISIEPNRGATRVVRRLADVPGLADFLARHEGRIAAPVRDAFRADPPAPVPPPPPPPA
jgi:hypothetical protein